MEGQGSKIYNIFLPSLLITERDIIPHAALSEAIDKAQSAVGRVGSNSSRIAGLKSNTK